MPRVTTVLLCLGTLVALPGYALVLSAGFALGVFVVRSRYRRHLLLFSVLPGLALPLLALGEPAGLLGAFAGWAVVTAALALVGASASAALGGSRFAPFVAAPVAFLGSFAGFVPFLLAAQIAWTFERQADRDDAGAASSLRMPPRALLAPLAVVVGAALLLGVLAPDPVGALRERLAATELQPVTAPDGEPREALPEELGPRSGVATVTRLQDHESPFLDFAEDALSILGPVVLVLAFLVTLILLVSLWLSRGVKRLPGGSLLPMALAAVGAATLVAWFYVARLQAQPVEGTGEFGVPGPAAVPAGPPGDVTVVERSIPRGATELLSGLAVVGGAASAVLLALLAYFLLRELLARPEPPEDASSPLPPGRTHGEPDDRVRRAYARCLRDLRAAGSVRRSSESPRAYAVRIAGTHDAVREPLERLTALYEDVRYGGRPGDDEADAAERYARAVAEAAGAAGALDHPLPGTTARSGAPDGRNEETARP